MADLNIGFIEEFGLKNEAIDIGVKSFQGTSGKQLASAISFWAAELPPNRLALTIDVKGCNSAGVWFVQFLMGTVDGGPPEGSPLDTRNWIWSVPESTTADNIDLQIEQVFTAIREGGEVNPVLMSLCNGAAGDATRFLTIVAWVDLGEGEGFDRAASPVLRRVGRAAPAPEPE